ncbi:LLM class flavin-dependent oxidoreductase [Ilumatobacter nonamiensis]|uniref:LLM class flavin-dependent oxidoreductase n=1 Tax=Ilumatobacter nonamiensis TaxID=467093 RepID=UPI00034C2B1E|nr:LLM class flavin-dependent oxidoreductase [Ilumatobacter nonamiensis]
MSSITQPHVPEISWFGALCDDDYEFLGVPDPDLAASWEHCRDIVQAADRGGFDNVLLPSGYQLGIDSTAFAAAIATHTEQINLLLAVRMGEMWLPQLARQLASIDQFAHGRLTINIISSDIPGEALDSAPRYQRTREWMQVLRKLLNRESIDFHGEFVDLTLDPPRISTADSTCPPFYFGGFSPAAKDVAAAEADVFLTWPDTVASVGDTVSEMAALARERYDRELLCGLRAHMIVRETEAEARAAAAQLVSKLDADTGDAIRNKSLDAASVGVSRQADLRESAADDGFVEEALWTGVGRARSGAGAAIVGDPDQVVAKLKAYQDAGVSAFILSGYTHRAECDLVAKYVLPEVEHAAVKPRFTSDLGIG